MSLVKGFTDILTPVNLVPNCDFSRGGGFWPSTFNVSTYTSQFNIRDEWKLQTGIELNISNITITLNVNVVTISFHVDSATGNTNNSQVRLCTTSNIVKKDHLYTCSCKYTVNTLGLEVAPYTSGSSVNYYRSSYDGKSKVQIYRTVADTYLVLSCMIPTDVVGKDIEITISDICLYEGMFCDPPYKVSLDSLPSTPFMIPEKIWTTQAQLRTALIGPWTEMTPYTYTRIMKIPTGCNNMGGKLRISKVYWIVNSYEHYLVEFGFLKGASGSIKVHLKQLECGQINNANIFKGIRFARADSDNNIYIELKVSGSSKYHARVDLLDGYNGVESNNRSSDQLRSSIAVPGYVGNTDTLIGQELIFSPTSDWWNA
jgi:hypothetical protein